MTENSSTVRIEDYALIGDCRSAALISNRGSIDWLCLPRFDSDPGFAALLGTHEHGHWSLAPADEVIEYSRRYVPDTFVLESSFRTKTGFVEVVELMPMDDHSRIIRRVTCTEGEVRMQQELVIRFNYGRVRPWIQRQEQGGEQVLVATAGPQALLLRGPYLPNATDHRHAGEFTLKEGESTDLVMQYYRSWEDLPEPFDVDDAIKETTIWWQHWAGLGADPGRYGDAVIRSLLVLRALTDRVTGGIVAAATTSLPEKFGGDRNWDYRYCWLRDAALTLESLLQYGYREETEQWRQWLLRAVAGDPQDIQIMYGIGGERDLKEYELDHLPGYADSRPVRVGNGAVQQFQADVIGEVMVALDAARGDGVAPDHFSWSLQLAMLSQIEETWKQKDSGIWEIRGDLQHFTHSRAMIWAALDCGIRAVREFNREGPVERWESLRDQLREEIETQGFDKDRGTYVQYYGSEEVDAALLQLPQIGYCEPDSERMLGTVAAIEKDLMVDGLLLRYRTEANVDGLSPGESPFLACSFWLVEQYARSGRDRDAKELMERLLSFRNDLGLLSEEYDVEAGRQAGNTPQALSHLALVRAASAIEGMIGEHGRRLPRRS